MSFGFGAMITSNVPPLAAGCKFKIKELRGNGELKIDLIVLDFLGSLILSPSSSAVSIARELAIRECKDPIGVVVCILSIRDMVKSILFQEFFGILIVPVCVRFNGIEI